MTSECSIAWRLVALRRNGAVSFLHLYCRWCIGTTKKQYNKFKNQMKGDIGMANYEKRVEQEAAYPIPISLYNCYRTVRHEKRGIAILLLIAFLMPHCPAQFIGMGYAASCSTRFS